MVGLNSVTLEVSQTSSASDLLTSVAPPPLAPTNLAAFGGPQQGFADEYQHVEEPPTYAKASWLDAMPVVEDPYHENSDYDGIAAVNADENGLYRMFIGVSP